MPKYSFCNNCGKQGHLYHQCKRPITSIGIIAFRQHNNKREFLMICRKNSLGFVDFMRGKYKIHCPLHLNNLINEMSNKEKESLLSSEFDVLWKYLWGDYVGMQYRSEESVSKDKFSTITNGMQLKNGDIYNLEQLVTASDTNWITPEWEFPKGRRNYQENDLSCALREFEEETGYSKNNINIVQNIIPFEEIYTGSNYKSYKHKYFIGMIDPKVEPIQDFQKSEVSQVKWLSLDECLSFIRPYHLEKKDMIIKINKTLEKYRLIS
jgi:8-oxo-dGTP pyrophosphatase MutT (NUDIX family)